MGGRGHLRSDNTGRKRASEDFQFIFGARFALALDATGLSARAWAEASQIPVATVMRTKGGHCTPGLERAAEYAQLLGVSLDWLVGISEEGGPEEGED